MGDTSTDQTVPARSLCLVAPAGLALSHPALCGLHGGSSLHIPDLGSEELGSRAQAGKQAPGRAGPPVSKHRHCCQHHSSPWWAAKEQNRDNGTRGDRNVLHFS